jgi:two-component system, OmpR family, sensor histidine kinase VicK
LTLDILDLKNAFLDAKNRGVKLHYVTEITKDNLPYCKQLMVMVDELRHLDGIKGNLYVSESGYLAPATAHERGKSASQIIYSNVKLNFHSVCLSSRISQDLLKNPYQ